MATFSFDGIGQAISQLQQADLFDDDTQAEMLYAAGDVFVAEAKRKLARARYKVEGMIDRVKYRKTVKTDKLGRPYITVSVYGKTAEGTPNSKVAFVLNYGRDQVYGRIPGDHFWTKAREAVEPAIAQKLREIADDKLRERGLI